MSSSLCARARPPGPPALLRTVESFPRRASPVNASTYASTPGLPRLPLPVYSFIQVTHTGGFYYVYMYIIDLVTWTVSNAAHRHSQSYLYQNRLHGSFNPSLAYHARVSCISYIMALDRPGYAAESLGGSDSPKCSVVLARYHQSALSARLHHSILSSTKVLLAVQ